jgi:DNA-binding HxlR family transcriptional regulator
MTIGGVNMSLDCNNTNCPVVATLDMIGGKYKALILYDSCCLSLGNSCSLV